MDIKERIKDIRRKYLFGIEKEIILGNVPKQYSVIEAGGFLYRSWMRKEGDFWRGYIDRHTGKGSFGKEEAVSGILLGKIGVITVFRICYVKELNSILFFKDEGGGRLAVYSMNCDDFSVEKFSGKEFKTVVSIKSHGGKIYVSDFAGGEIAVFTLKGEHISSIDIYGPFDVSCYDEKKLLVVSRSSKFYLENDIENVKNSFFPASGLSLFDFENGAFEEVEFCHKNIYFSQIDRAGEYFYMLDRNILLKFGCNFDLLYKIDLLVTIPREDKDVCFMNVKGDAIFFSIVDSSEGKVFKAKV